MAPSKLPSVTDIIGVRGFSDGDPNHRPTAGSFERSDAEAFMRKVAKEWMKEEGGGVKAGREYTLDKLPAGYALFERMRRSNPNHIDKYLFGHPSQLYFDSPYRFYPHFRYLMKYPKGDACSCVICTTGKKPGTLKSSTTKTSGIRGRPPLSAKPKDGEGSPLTLSFLLELLQRERRVERLIQEKQSMDWRAERSLVPIMLGEVAKQPSYIPRVGELVLWCRTVHGEIRRNNTGEYMFFDPESKIFTGYPSWLGGVITQVPISSQPVRLDDILSETEKDYAVNSSGFRVECYADPNSTVKDISKQYSYVPLHHIRPMTFWKDIVSGDSEKDWHPTIRNCLTAMATFSMIERYRFRGTWPNANVYAKGCFLGAESIFVGDTIRLMPERTTQVIDVLRITNVVLRFHGLKPKISGGITGDDASHISIVFHGYGYTLDFNRSKSLLPTGREKPEHGISRAMQGYGQWYHISEPGDLLSVSFSSVVGRLFEKEAVQKWIPQHGKSALDIGRPGTVESREYAKRHDARLGIKTPIHLSDSRIECLDLHSFNGIEVGPTNTDRDPTLWRNVLAVIDGVKDRFTAGRPPLDHGKASQGPTVIGFSPVNAEKSTMAAVRGERGLAIEIDSESASGSESGDVDVEVDGMIGRSMLGEGVEEEVDDELKEPERKRVRI